MGQAHVYPFLCPSSKGIMPLRKRAAGKVSGSELPNQGVELVTVCHGGDPYTLGHLDRILGRVPSTWLIHLSGCSIKIYQSSKCALSINAARSRKVIRATELPACTFRFMVGSTPRATQLPLSKKETLPKGVSCHQPASGAQL